VRTLARLVGVLAIGIGLTACGADGGSGDAGPTPTGSEPSGPSTVLVTVGQTTSVGVVLTDDGHVLTVSPNAEGGAAVVALPGAGSADGTVVGMDRRSGVLVVKVDADVGLTAATFADSDAVAVGDQVSVVAVAPGSPQPPVSGTVRSTSVVVGGISMLQVEAAASTGGVVTTAEGALLGILTSLDGTGDTGLVTPANLLVRVARQIVAGEPVTYPYLGVSVDSAPNGGAVVRQVAAGSPAERAGLLVGDVITRVGHRPVSTPGDLVATVQSTRAGDEVRVDFLREGVARETTVTVAEAPVD